MQHELGWRSQTIDFVNGCLQRPYHIRIRRLVKSHVTVADLDEVQLASGLGSQLRHSAQAIRLQDAPLHDTERSGSCPGHTLQETPAVDPVVIVIDQKLIFSLLGHLASSSTTSFFNHPPRALNLAVRNRCGPHYGWLLKLTQWMGGSFPLEWGSPGNCHSTRGLQETVLPLAPVDSLRW